METNQIKKGIILSYASLAISAVFGLIQVPIYTKLMGESEYGIYGAMGSILASFSVMDFGLSATIVRFYSRYKALKDSKNMENILAICSILYSILSVLALLIGGIVYLNFNNWLGKNLSIEQIFEAKQIYIVILINIAFTIPSQLFTAILNAHERFSFLKLLNIFQTVAQFLTVIAVLIHHPTALTLVIIITFFNLIIIPIKIYYCFVKLKVKIKLHSVPEGLLSSILSFTFLIFLTTIVDQLLWRANPIILLQLKGPEESAIYTVAFTIFTNYMLLSTVISSVFLPKVTHMVTMGISNTSLSNLFIKVGRIQFLLLSCVLTGFILFGMQFIDIFTSKKSEQFSYSSAYYITLLLIVPFTIDLIQNIVLTILQAKNKILFRTCVFLSMAIVNVFVAYQLAKFWGGIGCAFATGLVFLIGNLVFMNIYYAKHIYIDIKEFWKQIGKISFISLICYVIGLFINSISLFPNLINFALKIVLYVLVYFSIMWALAMNDYEKGLIKGLLRKITIH